MSGTVKLNPVPAVTRRHFVADALREAILSGLLRPGTPLVETQLARQFRVSRGPLREAMHALVEEGLLVTRPYAATHVAVVDENTLLEAYTLRRTLEVMAMQLAWPRRDQAFRAELQSRHAELKMAAARSDRGIEVRAELRLHSVPFEFSGHGLLLEHWRQLAHRIQLGFLTHRAAPTQCAALHSAHERYVGLALGDDLAKMVAEIELHIDLGIESIRTFWSSRRDADDCSNVNAPAGG
jgi:DNA-binding GntR family transcriptional regulator